MARLLGPLQLQGRIGNLSFFQNFDGDIIVRTPGGPRKGTMTRDPRFVRTLENSREFVRAQRAVSSLKAAFGAALKLAGDNRYYQRLRSTAVQVLRTDTGSMRGERSPEAGNLQLFAGFDFNVRRSFARTFDAPYQVSVNRLTGEAGMSIPAFLPSKRIEAPAGATHARFFVQAAFVGFERQSGPVVEEATEIFPLDGAGTGPVVLETAQQPLAGLHLFLLAGIRFFGPGAMPVPLLLPSGNHALVVAGVD